MAIKTKGAVLLSSLPSYDFPKFVITYYTHTHTYRYTWKTKTTDVRVISITETSEMFVFCFGKHCLRRRVGTLHDNILHVYIIYIHFKIKV